MLIVGMANIIISLVSEFEGMKYISLSASVIAVILSGIFMHVNSSK